MKNIQQTKFLNQPRRQKGFTLMEIAIVMIIMAALVATLAGNLWSKQDSMSIQQTILFLNKSIPQAIANMKIEGRGSCFTIKGCEDGDDGDMLTTYLKSAGASEVTEWGEDWSATSSKGVLSITFSTGSLAGSTVATLVRKVQQESEKGGALVKHDGLVDCDEVPDTEKDTCEAAKSASVATVDSANQGEAGEGADDDDGSDSVMFYVRTR